MNRRLYRSRTSRMLGGVCGGIAEYMNADPTVIRLVFLALGLGMGAGVILYIAAWLIMPEGPDYA